MAQATVYFQWATSHRRQTGPVPHRQRGLDQRQVAILQNGNLGAGAGIDVHRVVQVLEVLRTDTNLM